MVKTFLKRWWIANRLYHFTKKADVVWVNEDGFIQFLFGTQIEVNHSGKILKTIYPTYFDTILHSFSKKEEYKDFQTKTSNLIQQCSEERVDYIRRDTQKNGIVKIAMSSKGEEIYSFSYLLHLFFSNYYVRWAVPVLFVYLVSRFFHNITIQR